MGVTLTYYRFNEAFYNQLVKLIEDDTAYDTYFYGDEDGEYEGEVTAQTQSVYSPDSLKEPLALDIQKQHEALHFLLTSRSHQKGELLFKVVHGGYETPFEASYGPMRRLEAIEVQSITAALEAVTTEDLRVGFESRPKGEMYGQNAVWSSEDWNFLLNVLEAVRAFFRLAASRNELILIAWE